MWNEMALDAKLPMCKMPNGTIVLSRDKIGRKLWKTKKDNKFMIYDPNCIEVGYQYNALHDEHLKPFFSRKVNRDYMLKLGLINEEGEVICTLKQFNEYRRYLKRLLLYDFENALERRDEAEREYNLFAKSKAFGIIDLDHELKISIRKEKMKDATEKILLEAKERKERCVQRRKLYAERVMKLARRKEEEARQRIVKARLQDDKICNRIAMAKELKRRNNIVTTRHWNESEAQRQSRMKRQHLEDAIRNNTKLAEFWENKKQQQMEKIIKNKKIIEEYLTNQEIGIAIRNKLMQEETFYMEQRLYEIKSKNSKDKIKAVAKTKQKAIEMAVTKAWGSKRASMALSGKAEKMMVAESVQAALSVFRGDPGVGDIYRVLEGAKAKLERIVDVPEPVNLAIDALLEKVITVHVQKNVANILNDVFLKTEESAITPVEEGKRNTITNSRISTLSTKRDTGRCSPKSLNFGSRNQSYTLHKGMGSILKVQRGVSFGNVQTVERIPTNSDLRSIKDRPPTPVVSFTVFHHPLTELAEAVFNEPIIMTEFELGELSTEKNSLKKLFQALTKHLLANVKKRTEKSIESKQKLLYHPTIALGRSDVTKRITQAILLRHNDDIMNSEEIQNAIDCLVRDLLCAYQKAQRGSTSSTRAQLKVLSEANPTLFESENEDNQHG